MKKKKLVKFIVSIIVVLSIIIGTVSSSAVAATDIFQSDEETSDYILCTTTEREADKIVADNDYDAEKIGNSDVIVKASLTEDEVEKFERNSHILYIEEDFVVSSNSIDTDGESSDITTWNLEAIGWNTDVYSQASGEGVKVAILDSGIDVYSDVIPAGTVDFADAEAGNGDDYTGHGTAIAGVIASPYDNEGTVGIAPNAEIYNVRVLDSGNRGNISTIIAGLDWCIENEVDIINMSFGTVNYSRALASKIAEVAENGIIMVASAGNGNEIQYPAKLGSVIAVGSVNSSMVKSSASATGSELEIVAPGENIYSSSLMGGYSVQSGTSIAAAHITGIATALLSKDTTKSAEFIRTLLTASAKNLGDSLSYGYGLADISYALENYDDFVYNYSENSTTSDLIAENDSDIVTFEDEDIYVEGLWSKDYHSELIDYSYDTRSYNIRFPVYVKSVSKRCDDSPSSNPLNIYADANALHGGSNYIVTAKLLYEIAANYKVGTPGFTHINYRYDLRQKLIVNGTDNYKRIMDTIDALFDDFNAESTNYESENLLTTPSGMTNFASVNQKKATIVFGMLFHLLGDIYAHRTIVPPSSLSVLICQTHAKPFGNDGVYFVANDFVDDCGNHTSSNLESLDLDLLTKATNIPYYCKNSQIHICYVSLKRLAGLGILQFKDIKYFLNGANPKSMKDSSPTAKSNWAYYEDSPEFFNRRFQAAKAVTNHYFVNFYDSVYVAGTTRDDDIVPFLPYYLLPTYSSVSNYKLKIDQYYNYLKDFHSGSTVLTSSYWQTRGDDLFDYTTIVYDGKYFIDPATYPSDDPETIVRNDGKPKYYTSVFPENTGHTANDFYYGGTAW